MNDKSCYLFNVILFDNFYSVTYRTDEFKRRRERRFIVYGTVARYGPRTNSQRK